MHYIPPKQTQVELCSSTERSVNISSGSASNLVLISQHLRRTMGPVQSKDETLEKFLYHLPLFRIFDNYLVYPIRYLQIPYSFRTTSCGNTNHHLRTCVSSSVLPLMH